jgi:hypothetical protein
MANPIRILSVSAETQVAGVLYEVRVQNVGSEAVSSQGTLTFLDDLGGTVNSLVGTFAFPPNEVTLLRGPAQGAAGARRVKLQLATRWGPLSGLGEVSSRAAAVALDTAQPASTEIVILGSPQFAVDEDHVQVGFSLFNRGGESRSGSAMVKLLKNGSVIAQLSIAYSLAGGGSQDFVESLRNTPGPGRFALDLTAP